MAHHERDYFARREEQERESAERSADKGARRIHTELAERYAELARGLTIQVPPAQM